MSRKESSINYLYFGTFFLLLLATITCSVLVKENLAGSRMFFWLYAMGQSLLEVSLFIFAAWLIERYLGLFALSLFIGFTFICFTLHMLDFFLDRVLDLSTFPAVFGFLSGESIDSFLLLLDSSGIPLLIWIGIFSLLALVPVIGVLIYKGTAWIADKRPMHLKKEVFFQLFVCIPAALFFWDYSASTVIQPDAYTEFTKSLPWKQTFISPETVAMPLPGTLHAPQTEQEIAKQIGKVGPLTTPKPNIYLFIIESLRTDFITPDVAPHLFDFKSKYISAKLSASNANWTNISWFSIFHSQFPFYWAHAQQNQWSSGAPPLQLFKKLGYKIRVYSSAQLGFYDMEKLLFGSDAHLIDSYQTFHHHTAQTAWKSDLTALQTMEADLAKDPSLQEGQLIIFFWDTTHFDYSRPKDRPPIFTPEAKDIAFFKAYPTKSNIEKIRNRYRNSVHYMDELFGQFLSRVDPKALIAVTGDHGEEFFDHGHLFHGSHLSQEQISVPIYFRIGALNKQVPLLSQLDIMPTLLDAISHAAYPYLAGESALRPRTWPYLTTARFNARSSPFEFALQNERHKIIAQFNPKRDIFSASTLRILSLKNCRGRTMNKCNGTTQDWIRAEFGPALDRLFSNEKRQLAQK